jgi:hypothetical protein
VHQAVEAVPAAAQGSDRAIDLRVLADVAGQDDVGAELAGELADAVAEALADVGEGELRALAVAGLRDAVGDRAVRQQAGDQDALAG